MSHKIVSIATIGTGWITEAFIAAVGEVEGLNLTAVYSRDKEKGKAFAKKHGALQSFYSLDELASADNIDAVYIASPNICHFEQSKFFLQHKKHVICEKPITSTKTEAEELVALAAKNDVIFMEAIMAMHLPQLGVLEEAISNIGRISMAQLDYCQLSSKYQALQEGTLPNIFNIEMKTGCIMDIGIYCVYLMMHLFPNYKGFSAAAVKLDSTIDLCGSSVFEYDNMLANLTYSKIANSGGFSEIQGDKGTVIIDFISRLHGISIKNGDKVEQLFKAAPDEKAMRGEAQAFYNYITDLETHSEKYHYLSKLAIKVSGVLEEIRRKSGVNF